MRRLSAIALVVMAGVACSAGNSRGGVTEEAFTEWAFDAELAKGFTRAEQKCIISATFNRMPAESLKEFVEDPLSDFKGEAQVDALASGFAVCIDPIESMYSNLGTGSASERAQEACISAAMNLSKEDKIQYWRSMFAEGADGISEDFTDRFMDAVEECPAGR